jgi:hypothetical protein
MSDAAFAPFRVHSKGLAETPAFPNTPLERVRAGATCLRRTTALARTLAAAGRPIDLAGLDGQIGLVCARALDLPPEEGRIRIVRGDLQALLAEVDALTASLRLTLAPS